MDKTIIKSDVDRISLLNHHDQRSVLIVTVLVPGNVGDYAAYRAAFISDAYTTQHDQWAADHGDKLPLHGALLCFPFIDPDKYRS